MGVGPALAAPARDQDEAGKAEACGCGLAASRLAVADRRLADRLRARVRDGALDRPAADPDDGDSSRATVRRPRPAPIVARISSARSWSTASPWQAQMRSTMRIWFTVSTGRSAPGMKTAAATRPFLRANMSIRCRTTARAHDGEPARERRGVLAELRSERPGDRLDRKASPRPGAHDVRGEHERDPLGHRRSRCDDDRRDAGAVRALEDALVLLRHGVADHEQERDNVAVRGAAARAPPRDRRRPRARARARPRASRRRAAAAGPRSCPAP